MDRRVVCTVPVVVDGGPVELVHLRAAAARALVCSPAAVGLTYRDSDDDTITVKTQKELSDAVNNAHAAGRTLELTAVPPKPSPAAAELATLFDRAAGRAAQPLDDGQDGARQHFFAALRELLGRLAGVGRDELPAADGITACLARAGGVPVPALELAVRGVLDGLRTATVAPEAAPVDLSSAPLPTSADLLQSLENVSAASSSPPPQQTDRLHESLPSLDSSAGSHEAVSPPVSPPVPVPVSAPVLEQEQKAPAATRPEDAFHLEDHGSTVFVNVGTTTLQDRLSMQPPPQPLQTSHQGVDLVANASQMIATQARSTDALLHASEYTATTTTATPALAGTPADTSTLTVTDEPEVQTDPEPVREPEAQAEPEAPKPETQPPTPPSDFVMVDSADYQTAPAPSASTDTIFAANNATQGASIDTIAVAPAAAEPQTLPGDFDLTGDHEPEPVERAGGKPTKDDLVMEPIVDDAPAQWTAPAPAYVTSAHLAPANPASAHGAPAHAASVNVSEILVPVQAPLVVSHTVSSPDQPPAAHADAAPPALPLRRRMPLVNETDDDESAHASNASLDRVPAYAQPKPPVPFVNPFDLPPQQPVSAPSAVHETDLWNDFAAEPAVVLPPTQSQVDLNPFRTAGVHEYVPPAATAHQQDARAWYGEPNMQHHTPTAWMPVAPAQQPPQPHQQPHQPHLQPYMQPQNPHAHAQQQYAQQPHAQPQHGRQDPPAYYRPQTGITAAAPAAPAPARGPNYAHLNYGAPQAHRPAPAPAAAAPARQPAPQQGVLGVSTAGATIGKSGHDWTFELVTLSDMGFNDIDRNVEALESFDGNIETVIAYLLSGNA